jgi:hypothetical protein
VPHPPNFAYRPVAAGGDFAKLRKDPYVREELIQVFAQTDGCSVRLRKLESGRAAIEAVRRALEHGSFALALESFYGDETMVDYSPKWIRGARLELRSFVSYLTDKDPYFPRWEYTRCDGSPRDEVVHPSFRARIERLHSEWQMFAAGRAH